MQVRVQELGADFYAFSGHKTYCPTGIGGLYARLDLLEAMEPYQGGGDMIRRVTFERTEYNTPPYKFEAGTPHIEGAVGLGAGLGYLAALDLRAVAAHEAELLAYATEGVGSIQGIRLIGTAAKKAGVLSFVVDGVHPHDVGTILDSEGIAVRAGHHCAQPVMDRFGVPATVRASFGLYNTVAEVDALVRGIHKARKVFG
jgi:cysteine desulfurase/selenocysteine lyase